MPPSSSPKKKNSRLYAETGEDNTITIVEGKLAPFTKAYNANAYWSCTFIDEDTAMLIRRPEYGF